MPRNFPTRTQAELEEWLRQLEDEKIAGKTLVGAGAGDVTSNYVLQSDVQRRIDDVLYDLYQLDPTNWPLTNLHSRRAVARFHDRIVTGQTDG